MVISHPFQETTLNYMCVTLVLFFADGVNVVVTGIYFKSPLLLERV